MANEEILPNFGGYITSPDIFVKQTGKFNPYGICSEVIFGPVNSYRCSCGSLKNKILDSGQTCSKCHVRCIDNLSRFKTFGKIKLLSPVIKSTKKNEIIKVIGKKNKQLLDPKQADANASLIRFLGVKRNRSEVLITSNLSEFDSNYLVVPFKISGLYSLIYTLRFVSDILKVPVVNNLFQNKCIIDEVDILPPDIRPIYKDPSNPSILRYEEINKFYISLLNSNKRNQLFNPTMQEELKIWTKELVDKIKNKNQDPIEDDNLIQYDQIAAFYQYYVDEIYNWCFEHIRGKEGLIRSTVLSRTLEFSARTVVSVDPSLPPYQIKVPREMLFTLWFPYFINYLVNRKQMRYDETYYRVAEKSYLEIKRDKEIHDYFIEFLDWFAHSEEAKII